MKQYLIQLSTLLILLLVGTASAIGETENTNAVLLPETGLSVSLAYNETGHFKMGDVVNITATFNKPVIYALVTVQNVAVSPVIPANMTNMSSISSTVWYFNYVVPGNINDGVDVTVFAADMNGNTVVKTDTDAFVIDNEAPRFKRIKPSSDAVNTIPVVFNFSAFDRLDNSIAYTLYINGTENKTGTVNSNVNEELKLNLTEGYYIWEIKLRDDAGNEGTSQPIGLYVDTQAPNVTLVSPADLFVVSSNNPLMVFNFTSEDNFSAKHNLDLYYQQYIDGEPVDMIGSREMVSGEYVKIPYTGLPDGAHNWSVSIEDRAGNNVTSEVRNLYVNNLGLSVQLISPNGGFVPANPMFNFSVSGGAGLPFGYELFINGTKVKNGTFVVGNDTINHYSVNATVADAENIPWTVRITDCAGNIYQPQPLYFSVDTKAPAPVSNLSVTDALGNTTWLYTYDEPGLYVRWDKNNETDLANVPYAVFISTSSPSSIEEMVPAEPVSYIFDNGTYMYMNIGKYVNESLVYGKDYWVAVIAIDRAGNYNESFAVRGPVQTYEDMNITLEAGWNLKSVPKSLLKSDASAATVFGNNSTVIYWNGSSWKFPKTIEPCKGYWVYTPETRENNIRFKPMSTDSTTPDTPASLDLAAGWQMIGHTSTVPVEWSTTMASLKGTLNAYKFSNLITYSQDEGWGGIIPDTNYIVIVTGNETSLSAAGPVSLLQTDEFMAPGQGYWIFMKEDGTYASIENSYSYEAV